MSARRVVSWALAMSIIGAGAACRGRVANGAHVDAGEGEGEDAGELPDARDLRLLVGRGEAVAATDGPDVPAVSWPTPPAGVVVVDLGNLVVGADGRTGAFHVDVDERIHGLTVVVYGDADAFVIPMRVLGADGMVVVDDAPLPGDTPGLVQLKGLSRGFTGQFASPGRVLPQRGMGAFQLPSSPDLPLTPGRWRIQLGQFDVDEAAAANDPVITPRPGAVRVAVLLRVQRVGPGAVGLAFHFTGAAGLTTSTASASPAFLDMLALVGNVYGGVDVDVTDVALLDIPDGDTVRTVVLATPACDGGELDALAARGVPDRLNVFVIDRFECGAVGPFLLGLSSGLPVLPWAQSPRSGVVVAGSFLLDDPALFAVAVAHELGHTLGLYHSRENDRFNADIYDVVNDTPDDDDARANLMYFDVSRGASSGLSVGQGRVIQTSSMVLP